MLDGKKVVGPDGGTYRATPPHDRRARPRLPADPKRAGASRPTHGARMSASAFSSIPTPTTKILHHGPSSADMNGLVQALTSARRPSWVGKLSAAPGPTSIGYTPEPTPSQGTPARQPCRSRPAARAGPLPRPAFRPDTRPGFAGGTRSCRGIAAQPANAVGARSLATRSRVCRLRRREAAILREHQRQFSRIRAEVDSRPISGATADGKTVSGR